MLVRTVLIATVVLTGAVVADVLRRDELSGDRTALYLSSFTVLFAVRVVGQVVVLLRAPRWLPPMEGWNLVPYRVLLPTQLAFLAVMGAIVGGLLVDGGPLADQRSGFGRLLVVIGVLYAASMVVRYCVRMYRRPAERWFGGAIPIAFHLVLAAFLFTWGRYHVAD